MGKNHARFFESGNSWPKFWTVQNFWAGFPIDLQIARTHYGLCESVKIFTKWLWFSQKSKYLSICVNSWGSGPVWNRGITNSRVIYAFLWNEKKEKNELKFFWVNPIIYVSGAMLTSVNSEIFARILFHELSHMRSLVMIKPSQKWQNHSVVYWKSKLCTSRDLLLSQICLLTLFTK